MSLKMKCLEMVTVQCVGIFEDCLLYFKWMTRLLSIGKSGLFFVMGWESAHQYISLIKCILQSIKGYLD